VKVVSNAGPLIALGKLGQLGLLLKLYGEILIPREVCNEVVINGLHQRTPL
jgi:predicted nucleic acid-binding protein